MGRSPAAPQVPTMAEAGLSNYVTGNWYGTLAPAATPRNIVALLNKQVNAILARPDVKEMLITQGYEPAGGSSESFAKFIKSEIAVFAAVIKSAGIQAE
jgi:tripartite-type tricarboxylate transporter receptor subunit TctC